MSDLVVKRIGIAIVEQDGRYLIGTRGPDGPLAGYDEFPGGKCLPGETPEACAIRECHEETGLTIKVDRLLLTCTHTYPHATVELHFFRCHPADVTLVCDGHQGFRWVAGSELSDLHFPEANAAVLPLLSGESA